MKQKDDAIKKLSNILDYVRSLKDDEVISLAVILCTKDQAMKRVIASNYEQASDIITQLEMLKFAMVEDLVNDIDSTKEVADDKGNPAN